MNNIKLIAGTSHTELAKLISEKLKVPLCKCTIEKFSNTEIRVEILESIRNKDIFIIQTGSYDTNTNNSINDYLMETLITIDACKRSKANTINLVMPCYPYARQDKKGGPREPITARLVANILENAGIEGYEPPIVKGRGLNVVTGETVNMVKSGIIDPLLVT